MPRILEGRHSGWHQRKGNGAYQRADDDNIVAVDCTIEWTDHGRSCGEKYMLSPDQTLQLPGTRGWLSRSTASVLFFSQVAARVPGAGPESAARQAWAPRKASAAEGAGATVALAVRAAQAQRKDCAARREGGLKIMRQEWRAQQERNDARHQQLDRVLARVAHVLQASGVGGISKGAVLRAEGEEVHALQSGEAAVNTDCSASLDAEGATRTAARRRGGACAAANSCCC